MAPRAKRQPSHTRPHLPHRARRRPPLQVVDASPRPLPHRPAHALVQVTSEKVKAFAPARQVDRSRLLRMELKPEPGEYGTHPLAGLLDRRLRVAHDHKVSRRGSCTPRRSQNRT
jgi:hypothetical protein